MAAPGDFDDFMGLSVALTGFNRVELEGTGVGDQYFGKAVAEAGASTMDELLAAWRKAARSGSPDEGVRRLILSSPSLGPLARNVIKMWYLGVWEDGSNEIPVSAEAYTQGLVWDAIGAHTQGAKQQGFGAWALEPRGS